MMEKLKSRKFILTALYIILDVCLSGSGVLPWNLDRPLAALLGYLGAEGLVDASRQFLSRGGKQ